MIFKEKIKTFYRKFFPPFKNTLKFFLKKTTSAGPQNFQEPTATNHIIQFSSSRAIKRYPKDFALMTGGGTIKQKDGVVASAVKTIILRPARVKYIANKIYQKESYFLEEMKKEDSELFALVF